MQTVAPPVAHEIADLLYYAIRLAFAPANVQTVIFTISFWTGVSIFLFIPESRRRAFAFGGYAVLAFFVAKAVRAAAPVENIYYSVGIESLLRAFSSYFLAILIIDQTVVFFRGLIQPSKQAPPTHSSAIKSEELKPLAVDAAAIEKESENGATRTIATIEEVLGSNPSPSRALVPMPEVTEVVSIPQATALKLKRSQRDGMLGKVIFILDARMELSAEDAALVKKYKLGERVVYESNTRKKRAEATKAHAESTKDHPSLLASPTTQALGAGKTLFRIARTGVSAALTALALRITIDSLHKGVHVECKSLEELLEAEDAIKQAARNLKGYLAEAVGFDGREEIVEL